MDLNSDGRPDIISGSWPGQLYFFAGGKDGFTKGEQLKGKDGKALKPGSASTAFATDWDGDGDLDLLCGTIFGKVLLARREDKKSLVFSALEPLSIDGKPIVLSGKKGGGDTAPITADWDGDGDQDLLVGVGNGSVFFFANTASPGEKLPKLSAPVNLVEGDEERAWGWSPEKHAGEPARCGVRVKPCAVDYDGDGRLDLLVGDYNTETVKVRGPLNDEEKALKKKLKKKRNKIYAELEKEVAARAPQKPRKEWTKEERKAWSKLYGELFEGRRKELDAISKQGDKLETHENVGHGWIWFWKRKAAG